MSNETRRDLIFAYAEDAALDFVTYDRKDCEELPRGAIEESIRTGEVTVDEIAEAFANSLRAELRLESDQ